MNIEKLIMFLWGCVTVIFISMFAISAFLETVKIYKLSNGTTISLEVGSLAEIALIIGVYCLSKLLLTKKDNH